jgi:hypothetical protein
MSNSCVHFVKGVVEAAGVATPWMLDPRPNSYIGEFRSDFADVDFDPHTRELTISGGWDGTRLHLRGGGALVATSAPK